MSRHCESIRDRLSAYVDGELPPAEEAGVRAHLAECAGCREALTAYAMMDEAIVSEDIERAEEEWERLAARVDAAVARAHEADRHAARTSHGWRRRKPGFFGGLLPAPVAFGSAGTIVAAALVVLMHGLLEDRTADSDLFVPDEVLVRGTSPPAGEGEWGAEDRLRALGYLADGPAEEPAEEEPAAPAPAPVAPAGRAALPEAKDGEALRAVEPQLRVGFAETDAKKSAERPVALAPGPAEIAEPPAGAESAAAEPVAEEPVAADSVAAEPGAGVAETAPRTLADFSRDYARQRAAAPAPTAAPRDRSPATRSRPPTARPDVMTRALEEQRRERDAALDLALAREVYLFAQERREDGDRDGAITALLLLLDNEHGRIREQAWADLIHLEGEKAIESDDAAEIARVAATADAFLREYPGSRFRLGVIKRRVNLWAEAAERQPGVHCQPARAAEAEWQAVIGAQSDPAGARAAERSRSHCP